MATRKDHPQLAIDDFMRKKERGQGVRPLVPFGESHPVRIQAVGDVTPSHDIKRFVPSDPIHPCCGICRHTLDLPRLQCLYERALYYVLHKLKVVKAKHPSQHCDEFARLMPKEMIHKMMDAGRVAHCSYGLM